MKLKCKHKHQIRWGHALHRHIAHGPCMKYRMIFSKPKCVSWSKHAIRVLMYWKSFSNRSIIIICHPLCINMSSSLYWNDLRVNRSALLQIVHQSVFSIYVYRLPFHANNSVLHSTSISYHFLQTRYLQASLSVN